VQSVSGSIRNGHILASVKEENQGQEHVSSEGMIHRRLAWFQKHSVSLSLTSSASLI
jgi:hypothetical protein